MVFVYFYGYIRVYDCENHSRGLLLWARAEANMSIIAARHRSRKYSTFSAPTSRPVRINFYQLVCNDWLLSLIEKYGSRANRGARNACFSLTDLYQQQLPAYHCIPTVTTHIVRYQELTSMNLLIFQYKSPNSF